MLEEINISDIIIKLHDLSREIEKSKYYPFGKDLRDIADRLSRVNKQYLVNEHEKFVYDYIKATNGMETDNNV